MGKGTGGGSAAWRESLRRPLLGCGIAAALVYVGTDIAAALLHPDYSLVDQTVSELFAIGAPTAPLVVGLFSLASVLLAGFASGIALSTGSDHALRWLAILFAASAADALALWALFPMHARGEARGFTDTMHLVLGANPFVWLTLVAGAVAFRGWFRWLSVAVLVLLPMPAVFAFQYVPAIDAGAATPGLGLAERVSQYGYQAWQVLLAMLLLRRSRPQSAG